MHLEYAARGVFLDKAWHRRLMSLIKDSCDLWSVASLCLTDELQGYWSRSRLLNIKAGPACQSKLCVVNLLSLITIIVKITGNIMRFV